MKRYLAISALEGRDELYFVSKNVERKFNKLFGEFDSVWQNHEHAVDWLRKNAKFVGFCTCVTY
jgi:hypothetical protein